MRSGFGLYREGSTGEGQIIAVQSSRLEKRSYAIIFKDIDIMLENAAGGGSIRGRDFIDIELHARAPNIVHTSWKFPCACIPPDLN